MRLLLPGICNSNPRIVPVFQVANSSYVWLPLLPREDGLGYTLLELEEWRPRDYIGQVADKSCPVLPHLVQWDPAMRASIALTLARRRLMHCACSRMCISLPGPETPTLETARAMPQTAAGG